MIDYPPELPLPQRDGYGLNHVSPLMRSELASGRARQRRRFTSVPTMAQVSWLMTQGEAQLFEGWFRHVIEDGADWFSVRLRTPVGLRPYEARFADMYRGPELVGLEHWRFTAELEIRDRQTVAPEWVAFPLYLTNSRIIDLAMNREWPAA